MNFKRGLHRIFVLGAAGWIAYALVGIPAQQASDGAKFSGAVWNLELNAARAKGDQAEVDAANARYRQALAESSLSAVYSRLLRDEPWFLPTAAVVPPLIVYGVSWALFSIGQWLWRGFK